MAIFHSYVSLPEGKHGNPHWKSPFLMENPWLNDRKKHSSLINENPDNPHFYKNEPGIYNPWKSP